ncbi:MAG: PAS domain S-box protein [Anaerolineaceae bacterium]|nr:PAS domain S-box protein [Anaerolineaceae bacterium]
MNEDTLPTEKLFQEIHDLRAALANAQAEIEHLSQRNQEVQSELDLADTGNLALQHQANRYASATLLHKAAVISQKISTVREPDMLATRAIALIRSNFELYHVHIYLLDAAEQVLRLHHGSGRIGKQMQAEGRIISLQAEKSLVALAARQRRMVLSQNVAQEPLHLANPLLPATRSELSIPLEYGRTLLGILDIQDSQINRFSPAEVDALVSLAGHVAVALRNAQLFSERRQIQQKLLYQANLLQNVSDAVIATDNQFCIQSWNKAAEKMYGWKSAEVLGQVFDKVVPQIYGAETYEAVMAEFLARGQWQGRVTQQRRDGSQMPILASVTAVKDATNTVIGAVAVNRDISNQLAIEEALRQRTHSLEASNEELAQFAYAASHDLQEPLRMITAYLQLLASKHQGTLDEESNEFIAYALDGASRMRQLITDLLAYSRVGQKNQTFTQVDLEKILEQVCLNLEMQVKESQVIITHDPLPTLVADKTQMLQLLQNLISNALKFRSSSEPKIHLSAKKEKDRWLIKVSDNGIGIDPKFSQKIFTLFQRLHTRDEYPGTGIGLAMCKKIIQKHGGEIWVESALGAGSTFYLSLPENST